MTTSHAVVVVCEGTMDRDVAMALARKILSELADWMSDESFRFMGLGEQDAFQSWAGLKKRQGEVPRRNGFHSEWGPDSATAWKALHLAKETSPDAVILLRDADGKVADEKRKELAAAVAAFRRTQPEELPVAIGVADAKLEAWLLASIEAAHGQVEWRTELRQELGFDPVTQAEQLTATDDQGAKRNAKNVLARLMTVPEALASLRGAPLTRLLSQGARTGLPEFLRALRCELGRVVVRRIPDVDWCQCPE